MNKIDISAPKDGRRDRFFARAAGTKFEAKSGDNATQIDLYDEIGYWGVTHSDFRSKLANANGDIVLRINSPGGDVFDGIGIYNDLLAYKGNVRVEIVGVAASIASIIAMAGDEIVIAPNAFFMIHNAWTIGIGNRHDFSDVVSTLTKIDDSLARTYAAQTTTGIRQIKQMMDDETWLDASEAVDMGFATSIVEGAQSGARAKFDLSVFANLPSALVWNADETESGVEPEPTVRDVERGLRDAGWSRSRSRAGANALAKTIQTEATRDAGDVDLKAIAAVLKEARANLHTALEAVHG